MGRNKKDQGITQDIILGHDEFALAILREELERRNPKNYQWRTKDGTVLDVKDMTDSHLQNSINMLEKYLHEREIFLENWIDATDYYD